MASEQIESGARLIIKSFDKQKKYIFQNHENPNPNPWGNGGGGGKWGRGGCYNAL